MTIQNGLESNYIGYGFYKLNENMTEDYLKLCKLRIIYDSKEKYIRMKMRTLIKACGYKRRTTEMIEELLNKLSKLELYISDGYNQLNKLSNNNCKKIKNIKMDEYIRIYSY